MENKKISGGGGSLYNLLNKDIKELNGIILSLFCIIILLGAGFLSYKITNSYALFSDSIESEKTIEVTANYPSFDTSGANEPVLSENMIPVYYDETCDENVGCWRKAYEKNTRKSHKWYNYDEKMWANSITVTESSRNAYKEAKPGEKINMDDVLTMQVWVPRYKYKVWNYNKSGTVSSQPQEIQITFEEGTKSTGEITCIDNVQGTSDGTPTGTEALYSEICKLKTNNTECTDEICNNKTYTHPAFTFGDKELTGFWVGKFEISSDIKCTYKGSAKIGEGCNLITVNPLVLPNVNSWNGAILSVYQYNLMKMNDSNNIYGFTSSDDTHMIKNMEWGAIAYLSHSKYGKNAEVEANRNDEYLTGCGPISENSTSTGTICNAYNTVLGQKASTTGNVYGIYDMVGSHYNYVMGNIVSPDGNTMLSGRGITDNSNSGYEGKVYDEGNFTPYTGYYEYPDDKYIDKYSYGLSKVTRSRSKLGDATKEVVFSANSALGWYQDHNSMVCPNDNGPWTLRGGKHSSSTSPGIFYANTEGGHIGNTNTFLVISQ